MADRRRSCSTRCAATLPDSEVLRQRLIHRAPKYGNDDDRVDHFAAAWGDRYCELVEQYPTIRGGVYQPGFYTVSAHVPMGANVGATPDGRHAGAPLADGGLSPTAGRDRRGRHGRAALGEQARPAGWPPTARCST